MNNSNPPKNVLVKFAIWLLFLTVASITSAGQVDPRFDGQWVGVETFLPPSGNDQWAHQNPQVKTIFMISDSGQTVRVLSGFVPGRYWVEPKSGGNTLVVSGSNASAGRNVCRLELSADGNTLKESCIAALITRHSVVDGFSNRPVNGMTMQVYATFKRAGNASSQPAKKPHS